MEKFAIDLDKVLDDFEFNEDCAEQIASVNSPISNVPPTTSKCSLEPSASRPYNYLVTDYGKTSKEFEIVSSLEAQNRSNRLSVDSRVTNERDAFDSPDYDKNASAVETADSVNHFCTHERVNEGKIGQKQTVPSCDSDQPSLTIYNDISQKLLQKQQNGSSSPKSDNRYDKKLNQPNIKPSVSNVFNSLNEYINAPPGSLDYVHTILDKQDVGPNVEFSATQEEGEISATNATVKHCTLVKSTTQDTGVSIVHEESSNRASIVDEASIQDCKDNIIVPVTLGTFVAQEENVENDNAGSVVGTTSESECKNQACGNVTVTVLNANDTQYEYKDAPADADASNSVSSWISKPNVECDSASGGYALLQIPENICDNERDEDSQLISKEYESAAYESTVQERQSAAAAPQSESVPKKTVVEIRQSDAEVKTEVQTFNVSGRNSDAPGAVRKPLGFSSIHDLSEEELSTYLAELEQEEQLKEAKSQETVSEIAGQSTSEERKDEDAHEAPTFESVVIGELSRIPHEEPSREAKKFPVIDCDQEQSKEADAQRSQESGNVKIESERSEFESVGEARRSAEKTNEIFEDIERAEFEAPTVHEESNSGRNESCVIAEKENIADAQHTQSVEEHYTYEEDSLSCVQTDALSKAIDDVSFNSVQYNPPTELGIPCEVDNGNSGLQGDRNAETCAESSANEINAELDRPARPQTLDIVLADHADDHRTLDSASVTPSDPLQSEIDGLKDDCQGSSPDALENSTMESCSVLGKQPPFWVPDSDAPSCMLCDVKFTVLKRRHHCRACGKVLCNKCCSMKYKLEYQGNIDSRVCVSCYQLLTKAESEQGTGDWTTGYTSYMGNNDINSPQGRQPNPNNPMEYCSTIPPLQQLVGGLPPPPTVMVPVGVLKREGGTKNRAEGSKSVMFSDELDMSWDLKPPYRKPSNKRIPTPGSSLPSTAAKRQNLPRIDPNTNSYVPQDLYTLPPTVTIHKGQVSYHAVTDEGLLYKTLKNECEPPVMFAINRNLYAYVKITNLNCCVNKICWNVTSRGLACVGQDEVILLVETLPDETRIPKDLLIFINQLYIEAIKGNTMSELGFSIYQGGNLLSSREHAGFLFIRQTLQCLQKIVLPPAPFLVGLLVHRWETPWAKVFPLRLLLRLGAEYRYYPCPLVSVRFRDALYFEIGHTVMKVLADFRNFGYTLPGVRGLAIHLRNRMTDVMLPRNRYDQVIKGLNNSNDHVLAYASNFSITADSHLVCIQTNTGDESSYQTQAINIHNKPRTVTGASFIVINGALKSSMGLSAKSSIVEDGLMVEIMPEKMEALKAALKNMQDFSIGCGKQGAPEPDETVNIKWVDNDVQFNLGVKSPIDGQLMDGIPSIRVHNGTDYKGTSRFIRWTEVFIIKSDDHPNGVHDPVDINKLSGNIAKATCTALVKLLDLLATAGLTKLGVRTTIHPDNVGYEAGSQGTKLPPIYMNSLDNELIQVLHKAAQSSQDTHTVLELIFYILDD